MRKLEYVSKKWILYSIKNCFFFYLQKNFQGSFAFFLLGIPWNNNKFFVFRIRNFLSEKMSLLWSPDIRNSQSIPQCTILSYFEAFLMKSCKYIWSTSNTTKRKLWPKNSKDSRFNATRLFALREYVVESVGSWGFFSLDEPRNDPTWFRRLSQNVYDNIKYRITDNFDSAMFRLVSTNLIFL